MDLKFVLGVELLILISFCDFTMLAKSGSLLKLPVVSSTFDKTSVNPQLNVNPRARLGTRAARCSASKGAFRALNVSEKKFFGARLRAPGSGRVQFWHLDGPGRSPKLRLVVRSGLSAVPEKPLGLYDPKFDKDSCGVGFVAELSGESSRKTVCVQSNSFWKMDFDL